MAAIFFLAVPVLETGGAPSPCPLRAQAAAMAVIWRKPRRPILGPIPMANAFPLLQCPFQGFPGKRSLLGREERLCAAFLEKAAHRVKLRSTPSVHDLADVTLGSVPTVYQMYYLYQHCIYLWYASMARSLYSFGPGRPAVILRELE